MPTPALTNALRFCIACSSVSVSETIKSYFRDTPTPVLLVKNYNSTHHSLNANILPDEVDFISIDQVAFEAAEASGKTFPVPLLVFTDNLTKYSTVKNSVFEYIQMPISPEQLEKKLKRMETVKNFVGKERAGKIAGRNNNGFSKTFLIRKGKDFQPLNTDSIAAFYSDNKVTFAYDRDGSKFIIQTTLIELESHLNAYCFFRASRQFIINKKFIKRITQLDKNRFAIILDTRNGLQLEIGQRNFYRLREWIEEH